MRFHVSISSVLQDFEFAYKRLEELGLDREKAADVAIELLNVAANTIEAPVDDGDGTASE